MTPNERYINFIWDSLESKLSGSTLYYLERIKRFYLIDTQENDLMLSFSIDTLYWGRFWGDDFEDKYGMDRDEFDALLVDYANNLIKEKRKNIITLNSKLNSRFLSYVITEGLKIKNVTRVGLHNPGYTLEIMKDGYKI